MTILKFYFIYKLHSFNIKLLLLNIEISEGRIRISLKHITTLLTSSLCCLFVNSFIFYFKIKKEVKNYYNKYI